MQEDGFTRWFRSSGYSPRQIEPRLTAARRVEGEYGDLDTAYAADRLTSVKLALANSTDITDEERFNARAALREYERFRDDGRAGRRSAKMVIGNFEGELTVGHMMEMFRERMPDFTTFEVETGEFWESEGRYKEEARHRVMAILADTSLADEQCGRQIYRELSQARAQGLPLSWRTTAYVSKAPAAAQTRFYEAIAALARLGPGDTEGLVQCARVLEELGREAVPSLKRGEVLGITISIYGTVNPNDACWFKVRIIDRLGKRLLGKGLFRSEQFELDDFLEFQDVLFRIRDQLDDLGWWSGSLIDIQGFIWVVLNEDYARSRLHPETITRETIEAAMDECAADGTEAFLRKYKLRNDFEFGVMRNGDPNIYPANAIFLVALGVRSPGDGPRPKPPPIPENERGMLTRLANRQLENFDYLIVPFPGGNGRTAQNKEAKAMPTNLILHGPPGTGKTWRTAEEAVRLCGEEVPDSRAALMARYRALQQDGRIAFVTFHQSYSYEDFVEGLRPETGSDEGGSTGFRLEPRPGIFREICARADQARTRAAAPLPSEAIDLSGRTFWKMGQGAIGSEDDVYDEAVAGNYIALGWGGDVDWSDPRYTSIEAIKNEWQRVPRDNDLPSHWTQLWPFRSVMKPGDIVIVPYGNSAFRAVAEVTGDYYHVPEANGYYAQRRPVRWLLTLDEPLPLDSIVEGKFTMRTLYSLSPKRVNTTALARLLPGSSATDGPTGLPDAPDQFVLIIDEINRANVSKVFGELITLLEPEKRLGMPDALTVTLPYSKKRDFGVPANLHIVGTMNTADRSIALLDTALRRRFEFIELMPEPDVLAKEAAATGIDLPTMLRTLNDRVEYLFDREHQIGHAYFIGCTSRADLDDRMRHRVIPLLAEYFHEDMAKVAAVLGDGDGKRFLESKKLQPPPGFDGDGPDVVRWTVRAVFSQDAYAGLM